MAPLTTGTPSEFDAHPERLRELREIRVIGRGATGEAVLAESPVTKQLYVIKSVRLQPDRQAVELGNEVEILKRLHHPNVIRYYGSDTDHSESPPVLRIIMEYADSGTLADWLSSRWNSVPEEQRAALISEEEIMACFTQIVDALAHVHSQKILHRDLKAENILLHSDNTLKLVDFGVSRVLNERSAMAETVVGSAWRAAGGVRWRPLV